MLVGFGRVDLSSTSRQRAIEVLISSTPTPAWWRHRPRRRMVLPLVQGHRTAEQPSTGPTWSSRSTPAVGTRTYAATRRTCPAGTPSSPRAPAPRPTRRPSGAGSTSSRHHHAADRRLRSPSTRRRPDGPLGVPSPGACLTSGSWQRPSPTGRTPSCWKRRRLISLYAWACHARQPDRRMGRLLRRGRRRRCQGSRFARDELARTRHADRPAVPGGLRG